MPERELAPARALRRLNRLGEDPHHLRPGPPRQVEARHRVAVPEGTAVAALGPPHDRDRRAGRGRTVLALLGRREVGHRPRPTGGASVLALAVELRRAQPVLQSELVRVLDARGAAPGCRRRTGRPATRRPAHRGCCGSPGRRRARACRPGPARAPPPARPGPAPTTITSGSAIEPCGGTQPHGGRGPYLFDSHREEGPSRGPLFPSACDCSVRRW